jgi:hypothetical protein
MRLRESPPTRARARELRRDLAHRLPPRADPELTAALAVLARPHTRVTVVGAATRPGVEVRIAAAVVRRRAVVAVQEPGPTPDAGGAVHLTAGHAARLGMRIAATLPWAPPGQRSIHRVAAETLGAAPPLTLSGELDLTTERGRVLALLQQPRTSYGHVRIEPRLDRSRPPTPSYLSWITVAGDGRYLVTTGADCTVEPATAEIIAARIQRHIPRDW